MKGKDAMPDYRNIVVLTGAGISAESGIKTFRASDGLWEDHRIEDVATPEGFEANPALVHQFYNGRRRQLLGGEVAPNPAHFALAELEQRLNGKVLLVTQNIDNLHERAGSKNLIHLHGELLKMRCAVTDQLFDIEGDIDGADLCACCGQPGRLRPHVVWFGEMPLQMDEIYAALDQCDLFLSIGTSGNVYPAAGFVQVARAAGADTIEVNLEPSQTRTLFAEGRYGLASEELPKLVREILA
ncbi:NAD-dependent protein deacylase [Spongiibacter taiwanensis]|uniref:Sir2 family NAD+-dependent deacetylase n=1 Tax=Spongiibacter taiwanensis TaxID=1748242 RepID=UPI002035628B|nr:Sir2 family NAD+-dependent deacetylase [Spongiibacter taiwanensis]USA42528.1 NAD-dependent protein deacylase [Spongiibacter taiwanensis]